MKTRKVDIIKPCDICGVTGTVYYDAPTSMGPWANLCEDCFKRNGSSQIGTKFELREKKKGVVGVLRGVEVTTLEDLIADADREIKCPNCGELRSVEPDAAYTFECDGCGSMVKVGSIL